MTAPDLLLNDVANDRLSTVESRLDSDQRLLFYILTDPAIIALESSPPNLASLIENAPKSVKKVDLDYIIREGNREQFGFGEGKRPPKLFAITSIIRVNLAKADLIANFVFANAANGAETTQEELSKFIENADDTQIIMPTTNEMRDNSATFNAWLKAFSIQKSPEITQEGNDEHIEVPRSPYDSFRNTILAEVIKSNQTEEFPPEPDSNKDLAAAIENSKAIFEQALK